MEGNEATSNKESTDFCLRLPRIVVQGYFATVPEKDRPFEISDPFKIQSELNSFLMNSSTIKKPKKTKVDSDSPNINPKLNIKTKRPH